MYARAHLIDNLRRHFFLFFVSVVCICVLDISHFTIPIDTFESLAIGCPHHFHKSIVVSAIYC